MINVWKLMAMIVIAHSVQTGADPLSKSHDAVKLLCFTHFVSIRSDLAGSSIGEFLRFGLVGLVTNVAAYLLYLGATDAGVPLVAAVIIVYTYSILQSFFLNRAWSYRHRNPASRRLPGISLPTFRIVC